MKEGKIQSIADKFFKERDLFAFNDDGTLTEAFKNYVKEEYGVNIE